jgi:hypothetical protein
MANDESNSPPSPNWGWFKATRSNDAIELIKMNPNAFVLAYIIASRARYTNTFNAYALARGEAFLGDYKTYGMTEQQYRTAKEQLQKHNFATFRSTSKGTIGKLMDTRLFDPLNISSNEQSNERTTSEQRTNNVQVTTNKKDNKENNEKEREGRDVPEDAISKFLNDWYALAKQYDGYVKRDDNDRQVAARITASGIPISEFLTVARNAREALKENPELGTEFWAQRALKLKSIFEDYGVVKAALAAALKSPVKKSKPCQV